MLLANVSAKENAFEYVNEGKGVVFVVANPQTSQKINEDYLNNFSLTSFKSLARAVEISLYKNVIAMAYVDGVLNFSAFGNGTATLTRNGETKTLLNPNGNLQNASGHPKDGDIITLRTDEGKIMVKFDSKKAFSFNIPVKLNNKIYLKSVRDDEVNPQSKRMTLIVALTLLGLLILGIAIGVSKKKNDDLMKKYAQVLTSAEENLNSAISLATSDPEKSRELFKLSDENIKSLDPKFNDQKVIDLKNKIEDSRQSILGEYVSPTDLFLDLSLLSSGFKGDLLAVSEGSIYVLDKNGKKVVKVEIVSKKSKVTAGPTVISDPKDIASYDDSVYILEGDGIYEVSNTKKKVIEKSWSDTAMVKIFGGNMYILDKSRNQISRYQGNTQGFGERQNWLSDKTSVDFSGAKSWSLDGAIYVLFENTKILKYSQGSPQSFRVSGVIPEIGNVDALFADPNNTYLYLLDRAGKRVVVTDKRGNYKAQYMDEKIGEATNLAVSEVDKKIILLTGEKLLQMEIKHL